MEQVILLKNKLMYYRLDSSLRKTRLNSLRLSTKINWFKRKSVFYTGFSIGHYWYKSELVSTEEGIGLGPFCRGLINQGTLHNLKMKAEFAYSEIFTETKLSALSIALDIQYYFLLRESEDKVSF